MTHPLYDPRTYRRPTVKSAASLQDAGYWTVDKPNRGGATCRPKTETHPKPSYCVDWEIFCPIGPELAFHVGCAIGDTLYLHGGVSTWGALTPSNKLYSLDINSMIWNEVRVEGSPALSHHACISLDNRFLLLIGGWNGKGRTSSVIAYDTEQKVWLYPKVSGFPEDAGLSSHTASLLSDGKILVLGREGTLRSQQKDRLSGNVYMLSGSLANGEYTFTEYSHNTESRSGHTTSFIGPKLYIMGGRNDNFLEIHSGYKSGQCDTDKEAIDTLVRVAKTLKPVTKIPPGRRHHVALEGSKGVFIHGGEKFDGPPNRHPAGEMYVMTDSKLSGINFYLLGRSREGRAGHVMCVCGNKILLHGGLGDRRLVRGDTQLLRVR
ncbi:kelch domain-containing protein 9-like [Pecten maximus]|uniref:kelch domain-containing protein 9-like n=1 Tax=Pecten maximus TaxID=6579 RepID=UPI0014591066|nr:kelch domain-containing protein 9-like [Pecten maximus]XP_033726827.1 kelch domain-containing protein 9-like [Pecten maximus]